MCDCLYKIICDKRFKSAISINKRKPLLSRVLHVLRFYCIQQESDRNIKFKPTREIFESLKFGLDIQTHLWYVVVLEKEA